MSIHPADTSNPTARQTPKQPSARRLAEVALQHFRKARQETSGLTVAQIRTQEAQDRRVLERDGLNSLPEIPRLEGESE